MSTYKCIVNRHYEILLSKEYKNNMLYFVVSAGLPSQKPVIKLETTELEEAAYVFDDMIERLNKLLF